MISTQRLRTLVDVTDKNDAEVTLVLASVVSEFESSTRRKWTTSTGRLQVLRPDRSFDTYLFLDCYPVTIITLVREREDGGEWVDLVEGTDYRVDLRRGMVVNLREEWLDEVEVTWTGGYANDTAPSDILYSLALEVRRTLSRDASEKVALSSEALSENGTTTFTPIPMRHPAFQRAITKYTKRGTNSC